MCPNVKLLIIGGCFPFQDNIEPNKLYHQILKKKIEELGKINLEIKLFRYDIIQGCSRKISEVISSERPDWVLFHLRVESMLLSSKLFCKYHDKEGNIVKRINVSSFKLSYRTKDFTKTKIFNSNTYFESEYFIRRICRELNYFLGYALGNWTKNLKDYLKLLTEIIQLCETEDIKLIISGPVSRPYSYFENQLSRKLYKYIHKHLNNYNKTILDLQGMKDHKGNFLFCEDLKRVNEIGHKRISTILYNAITEINKNIYKSREEVMY